MALDFTGFVGFGLGMEGSDMKSRQLLVLVFMKHGILLGLWEI